MRWNPDYPRRVSDLAAAPGDLAFVQGFVNTADWCAGEDELDTPRGLAGWLTRQGLAPPQAAVTVPEVERALRVREALRALLAANNGARLGKNVGPVLSGEASRVALAVHFATGGESRLVPIAGGLEGALGRLFATVLVARSDGRWRRLKACADPDCRAVFYDGSKNYSAKWCSMRRCGNRRNSRRSKRRRKRLTAELRHFLYSPRPPQGSSS